jgi:hypothetical protein
MTFYCGKLREKGIFVDFVDSCITSQANLLAMLFLKGFLRKYYLENSSTKILCLTRRTILF